MKQSSNEAKVHRGKVGLKELPLSEVFVDSNDHICFKCLMLCN